MGKLGTSGSSSNTITAGSVLITTGATGPYPVNISLNTIPGPDPYNLKICNESGLVVYDITDWDVLPAGVTYNPVTRMVSFWSDTLQIYSAVKYAHSNTTLTVKSIEPSSGLSGQTIRITNLSGTFSTAAVSTGVILTRSETTIPASNITVESADRITGNLSIPSEAENGPWQGSDGNVSITVLQKPVRPNGYGSDNGSGISTGTSLPLLDG